MGKESPKVAFQSTRPIRGATKALVGHQVAADISINAPHTGRDSQICAKYTEQFAISIHAPHTGRDGLVNTLWWIS